MASRGDAETARLKESTESQVSRLLTQLQDLEEMKTEAEIDEKEYESMRQDTIEQLQEFERHLKKLLLGDMSLIDTLGSAQLAVQEAICKDSNPDTSQMFKKKEVGSIRSKLSALDSDLKLGRITKSAHLAESASYIKMLLKLDEKLSPTEQKILDGSNSSIDGDDHYLPIDACGGEGRGTALLAVATKEISLSQHHAENKMQN